MAGNGQPSRSALQAFHAISHKLRLISVNALFLPKDGFHRSARDSWELREEFLRLKTDDEFREFLTIGDFADIDVLRVPTSLSEMIADMHEWQNLIHWLSITPRERWMRNVRSTVRGRRILRAVPSKKFSAFDPMKFEMATTAHALTIYPGEKDGAPAQVWSHSVIGAMLDSIHLEKMAGSKIIPCALEDCLATFRSQRGKEYCCTKHANLDRTRRYRARK